MAVAYVKSLVQLNLGADDAAFEHAIEKGGRRRRRGESYFKYAAALKHIFDDSTTPVLYSSSGPLIMGMKMRPTSQTAPQWRAAGGHNRSVLLKSARYL